MTIKTNKGFTLVELIIVIAILAIIMLIAIPNFSGIQQRMQVRADKASAAQIGKAVRIWYTDNYATQNQSQVPDLIDASGNVKVVPYTKLNGIGDHISEDLVADSLLQSGVKYSGGGKYYVTILYSGISTKFLIGIDYNTTDTTEFKAPTLQPETSMTNEGLTYNGTAPAWVYLES